MQIKRFKSIKILPVFTNLFLSRNQHLAVEDLIHQITNGRGEQFDEYDYMFQKN